MNKIRKIVALTVAFAMLFSCMVITHTTTKAEAGDTAWAAEGIISPAEGKLIGAGYIDVKWNNSLDNVKQYKVYVDGALKKTAAPSGETMTCEFYTTEVKKHTAQVMAELNDGSTLQTAPRTFYVTKKGVCVNQEMGAAVDPASMNIGWYYNWGYKSMKDDSTYKTTKFDDTEYVAMTWGDNVSSIEERCRYANVKGYKYLLSYNEPDLQWEANKQPDVMALRWNDTVASKGNLRLGSPATETFQINSTQWWTPFWNQLSTTAKNNMSFIAVHAYQHYYNSADTALQYLHTIDEIYAKYKKPIWITEFAVADSGNKFSPTNSKHVAQVQEFMKIVLKGLNERSYVERYAWFDFNPKDDQTGASGIFEYETGKLTALGQIYANIGNPAGYPAKTYSISSTTSKSTTIEACAAAVPTKLYGPTPKQKAFEYSFVSVDRAAGYQLQSSTNKNFSNAKVINVSQKSTKNITGTVKNLSAKKKYYVRVRAYKSMNGKTYYCQWSDVKNVTTMAPKLGKVKKVRAKVKKSKKITITWKKVSKAKKYTLKVGKKSYTTKKTKKVVKVSKKGKYTIKVRATASGYQKGNWSKAVKVKVK